MSAEEENNAQEKSTASSMADLARKILLTSVGAIFMTEGSIRKGLSDLKVPKEAIGNFLETILRQKDEFFKLVASEFSKFLAKVNVHEEIQKALDGMELHVDAKVAFKKKGEVVKSKISVKKSHA